MGRMISKCLIILFVTILLVILVVNFRAHLFNNDQKLNSLENDILKDVIIEKEEVLETHQYYENTFMTYELNNYSYILPNAEMCEDNGNIYIFEACIPITEREKFIDTQNIIIEALRIEGKYNFFLSDSYLDRSDSSNKTAYFLNSSVCTWNQILTMIQLFEGDTVNYGYAYGKANYMAILLGWKEDHFVQISREAQIMFLKEDPGRLNLVYPCFIEPYSTYDQINLAKTLSISFFGDTKTNQTEEGFKEQIQKYADDQGLLGYKETYLKFSNGGTAVPLIIQSLYVEEWITDEFDIDYDYENLFPNDLLKDSINWQHNISEMIRIHMLNDAAIADARTIFHFEEKKKARVLFFKPSKEFPKKTDRGYFDSTNSIIYVSTLWGVGHEYIHYMHSKIVSNFKRNYITWCSEAVAVYFSWNIEYEEYILYTRPVNGKIVSRIDYDNIAKNNIPERMSSMDLNPTEILMAEGNKEYYGAYALISFYIVEQYGENLFVQLMLYPEKSMELVGKTIEEIVQEWDENVQRNW